MAGKEKEMIGEGKIKEAERGRDREREEVREEERERERERERLREREITAKQTMKYREVD